MTRLVFAYGSNLSDAQLRERGVAPLHAVLAVLRHHRFAFDKRSTSPAGGSRANVVADPGRTVLGAVLELDEPALAALREYEGGYEEREVEVELLEGTGERVRAIAFAAVERRTDAGPPPRAYVEKIQAGLTDRHAPGLWRELVERAAALAPPARRFETPSREDESLAVVERLESLLVRLASGWLPSAEYADDALAAFCGSAVEGQRDGSSGFVDGSWSVLADARVDRDARFELGVLPSCTITAILAAVHARFPRIAARVPRLEPALRRGLEFVASTGLQGGGLDRTTGTLRLVHRLADGGLPELLAGEPDLSPALCLALREVRSDLEDLLTRAGRRGEWGVPGQHEIEDALARLRGFADA